jgi:hypothetical protein
MLRATTRPCCGICAADSESRVPGRYSGNAVPGSILGTTLLAEVTVLAGEWLAEEAAFSFLIGCK